MTEELRPITLNFTGNVFRPSEEEPSVEPVVDAAAVSEEREELESLKEQVESANRNNEDLHYNAVFTYDKVTNAEAAIQEQDARVAQNEELVSSAVTELESFKGRIDSVESGLTDAQKAAQDAHNAAAAAGESLAAMEDSALSGSTMEYVASDSDTVAPTEGWATTSPTRTEDTPYVWMRSVLTYVNGTSTTTSPVLLISDSSVGGGSTAAVVSLTASTQILIGDVDKVDTTPASAIVTGGAINTAITQYHYSEDGKPFTATPPTGVSRSGNTVTITGSSVTSRTITVKMSDDAGNSDTLTVAKVFDGVDGSSGPAGVGISTTTVEYTQSSSGTTPPTTGWETDIPTPVAGQFVWTRVTYTYTDGSTKNSFSVGRIGSDGTPGDDGVGISSTTTTYVLSTTGSTPPGSTAEWSASIPTTTASQPFLWTRTETKYTDNSTSTAYSVSQKGTDGKDAYTVILSNESHSFPAGTTNALTGSTTTKVTALKGATPVKATVGTITGQVTGLTTSINGNGTTSPTITISAGTSLSTKSGVLTIPVTADGTTFSKQFSWSLALTGAQGPKGADGTAGKDGAAGVGVKSITTYYKRQPAANAAPAVPTTLNPPSGWTTTEPDYVAGNALYRVDRVLYTNGTFSYSPVSAVSSYKIAVDALTSANGRNSIIRSTSNATGSVHPDTGMPLVKGDLWMKLTTLAANGIEIGRWIWDGSSWVSTYIGHQSISSVDVTSLLVTGTTRMNEAAVNRIIGDAAHFNLLTADKLVMAPGNIFPDPGVKVNSDWNLSSPSFITTDSRFGDRKVVKVVTPTSGTGIMEYKNYYLGVEPGASYTFSMAALSQGIAVGNVSLYLQYFPTGSTAAKTILLGGLSLSNVVDKVGVVRLTFRTPEDMDPGKGSKIQIRVGSDTNEIFMFTDISLIRATDATVILPGSISTSHINADTFRGFTISGATLISTLEPNNPNADNVTIKDRTVTVNRYDSVDNVLRTTMQFGGPTGDEMVLYGADGKPLSGFLSDGSALVKGTIDVGGITIGGDSINKYIRDNSTDNSILSYWQTTLGTPDLTNKPYGLCRFRFDVEPFCLYELQLNINIKGTQRDVAEIALRWATGSVSASSYVFERIRIPISDVNVLSNGVRVSFSRIFGTRDMTISNGYSGPLEIMPTLQASSSSTRPVSLVGSSTIPSINSGFIRKVGIPRWHWASTDSGGGTTFDGDVESDVPVSSMIERTQEWTAEWTKSWKGSTSVSDSLHHGYYAPSRRYSMIGIPAALRSAIVNANVSSLELYLDNEHTWYGSGMTAYISPHYGVYSAPSSPVTAVTDTQKEHFGRYQNKWVSLPSSWVTPQLTGFILGVGAGAGESEYGRFSNSLDNIKIRVTYEK